MDESYAYKRYGIITRYDCHCRHGLIIKAKNRDKIMSECVYSFYTILNKVNKIDSLDVLLSHGLIVGDSWKKIPRDELTEWGKSYGVGLSLHEVVSALHELSRLGCLK